MLRTLSILLLALAPFVPAAEDPPEPIGLRIYYINDLTLSARNFPGPEIELGLKPQKPPDKDSVEKNASSTFSGATIEELIKTRIRPDMWDPAAGVSIVRQDGLLMVMQRPSMHMLISELLDTLRKSEKLNVAVKALLIPAATLPRNTIFTTDELQRLFAPTGLAGALSSPRVLCANGQRMHSAALGIHTYRDVAITGTALNPTLATMQTGTSFDITPRLSTDRSSLEVEVRFDSMSLENTPAEKRDILLATPVEVLAPDGKRSGDPANATKLSIETPPPQNSCHLRTTLTIPSGKWVLAGTLRNPDAAAAEKFLLLFVSGEPATAAPLAKPEAKRSPGKSVKPPGNDPILRIYDLRDLSPGVTDFSAPSIDLASQPVSLNRATPFSCTLGSDLASTIKEKLLATEFADPTFTIDSTHDHLIVMQTVDTHERIAAILDSLRKTFRAQIAVKTVLVALNEVPPETNLNDDTLARLIASGEVAACPRLVCQNGQRAALSALRAFSYSAGLNLAGKDSETALATAFTGDILEVRPVLSRDKSTIDLELRFNRAVNLKATRATIALTASPALLTSPILPPGSTRTTTEKKYDPTNKEAAKLTETEPAATTNPPPTSERQFTSKTDPARLLSTQYVTGFDRDAITADSNTLATQLSLSSGKWTQAATFPNPDPKSPNKHLVLFVSAEAVEK